MPPAVAPLSWEDLISGLTGLANRGRALAQLESEIKEYCEAKHVFLVSSGKAALTLILLGLQELSSRREVIIPAYTCYSVPSAVLKAGLKLSLCDIDASTLGFDWAALERSINEKTLCVVPCHLFGIPTDMDRVRDICRQRGVYVVEDAAQAMGSVHKGRRLGTIGDVGLYSFGRGKNITCGSGGVIVTNSNPIADAIKPHYEKLRAPTFRETLKEWLDLLLMSVFIHPSLYWLPSGLPFLKLGETIFYRDFPILKLSDMKGAVLGRWKTRLKSATDQRVENGRYFEEQLGAMARPRRDDSVPYLRFPVLAGSREKRDEILSRSKRRGLGLSRMYPKAIHQIDELRADFAGKAFPTSEMVAERLLAVPTHQYISKADREAIRDLFVGMDNAEAAPAVEAGLRLGCWPN